MAGYVVNIEVQVPGDAIDNGEQLRRELERAQDGAPPFPRILVNEAKRMVCIALQVDGDDGGDATRSALDLLDEAWEEAFDAAPSDLLIVKSAPLRLRNTVSGLVMPDDERVPEDEAEEEPEAEPEAEPEFDPYGPLAAEDR